MHKRPRAVLKAGLKRIGKYRNFIKVIKSIKNTVKKQRYNFNDTEEVW